MYVHILNDITQLNGSVLNQELRFGSDSCSLMENSKYKTYPHILNETHLK